MVERLLRNRKNWIHDVKVFGVGIWDESGESTLVSLQKFWNVADLNNSEAITNKLESWEWIEMRFATGSSDIHINNIHKAKRSVTGRS